MAEHNFLTSGPKSYYNGKGQYVTCHSKDDVARAKQDGYTSANYVPSYWPKAVFNKKTGATQNVGKLEWTDEQNEAAVAKLGDDWTKDHVAVPEPVAVAVKPAESVDNGLFAIVLQMQQRISDLELLVLNLQAPSPVVNTATEPALEPTGKKR